MRAIQWTVCCSDLVLTHLFAQVEGATRTDYRDQLLVCGLWPFGEIALSCNAAGHSGSFVPFIKGIVIAEVKIDVPAAAPLLPPTPSESSPFPQ